MRRVSNSRLYPTVTAVVGVCLEYGVYLAYCGRAAVSWPAKKPFKRNEFTALQSMQQKGCRARESQENEGVHGVAGHCKFKTNYSNVS